MVRLAAIDIGTNSLHMIVVRVRPDMSFEVIDREKEMVRLGAGGLDGRALTAEAMAAALQVLSKFRRLAESHGVDDIVAVATSAVREAENGGEFLRRAWDQTGIRPRVISGTEEARLIHQAAAYGIGGSNEVGVAIDIGGGSVEITRGVGGTMDVGRSFKLGVIRLTERFVKSDPLSPRDERKLVRHIESQVNPYLDQIVKAGFDRVIGTSGTILSLGTVAAVEKGHAAGAPLRNRRIAAKQLHKIRRNMVSLDLERRLRIGGLEPRRADLAVAGAILLDVLLTRLGATELTLCDLSLREGLVLDYVERHRKEIAQAERYPDVRRRSVIELAERCNYWPEHSNQIARLAVASMLRLAESLDRSHAQVITGLELHDRGDDALLRLRTSGDAELELWSAARHAAPFEESIGKPLRLEVSRTNHVEQSHKAPRVPRETLRGRGDRRIGQDDATGAAGQVAQRRGASGVRHRMELVRSGQGRDQNGQEEERPDPHDVQPAARHRLR
jgi:exopolyphosphatase/pppGpp-phosphohydrolase